MSERRLAEACAEALANARRHAGARRIDVRAWDSDRTLVAEVCDDGRGLDGAVKGRGMRGMRERARAAARAPGHRR